MTSLSDTTSRSRVVPGLALAVVIVGTLTLIRLIGLKLSVVTYCTLALVFGIEKQRPGVRDCRRR